MTNHSYRSIVILEATEACNPQRRGIGMQLRAWFEAAPYADVPDVQFVLAQREQDGTEPLAVAAPNVRTLSHKADTLAEYIDYLYSCKPDVLFFSIATPEYSRAGTQVKSVAIDYGMEDLYCREHIAPRPAQDYIDEHAAAFRNFTGLITVSETSKRDLAWFFPEYTNKVAVVYPGALPFADAANAALPAALQGTRYFLIFGYEHKKNIQRIATAFNTFKQQTSSSTKLVIVGKPGYGAAEIGEHIDALPCADDIVRLGYISGELKALLLKQCRAVVALPIYEGFGISALEGLQAGKLVLVSDNGSLREVVGDAGYLADPFSVTAMTEQFAHIDTLAENPKAPHIPERLAVFDQRVQARTLLQHLTRIANG